MFVLSSPACSFGSMRPTGSWSWWRSGEGRWRPTRPRASSCGSGRRCRSGWRGRCSPRRSPPTPGCAGPATSWRSPAHPARTSRSSGRRTSCSTWRRPACGRGRRGRARSAPSVCASSSSRSASRRSPTPPHVAAAVRRFLAFAGDAVLVAHNARFDMAFLDEETVRATGSRVAATVLDTVALARTLLGRQPANLASLAYRYATDARPCHRALPDAEATAEILLRLIGLAQERGARSVGDLVELAATRPRRVQRKRNLAFGAPQRPGVYLFRDAHDQVLYVGKARDLRARLRSYFRSERQRPAVEGALGALAHIEWRVLGSELEAALEELRLIRELRPPANARATRPDRY